MVTVGGVVMVVVVVVTVVGGSGRWWWWSCCFHIPETWYHSTCLLVCLFGWFLVFFSSVFFLTLVCFASSFVCLFGKHVRVFTVNLSYVV